MPPPRVKPVAELLATIVPSSNEAFRFAKPSVPRTGKPLRGSGVESRDAGAAVQGGVARLRVGQISGPDGSPELQPVVGTSLRAGGRRGERQGGGEDEAARKTRSMHGVRPPARRRTRPAAPRQRPST